MDFDLSTSVLAGLKARAHTLRAESDAPLSHAAALERVAHEDGARDWNTRHAQATRPVRFALGDRVQGHYLGHAFTGTLRGLSQVGDRARVTLQFDTPIDVVRFDSFSALRRRVQATIARDGTSHEKTSDGIPHLVIEGRLS